MKELAKALAVAGAEALGEGIAALIDGATLDEAYAKMIETLSDRRLADKKFPDGRYVP